MTDLGTRGRSRPRGPLGSARAAGRLSVGRLVLHQWRHELSSLRREPIALFFALAFPLVFFVLITSLTGNPTLDERSGVRLAQFLAPAMAAFGLVMATFSSLAIGLAESREDGVLKRLRGTPLPPGVLVAARTLAGGVVALVGVVLLQLVGVLAYHVQIVWRTMPATLLTLVVGIGCFSAWGLAVAAFAPSAQAATAMTTGLIVPLSFVSDVFAAGFVALPAWLNGVGWFFPLRHLVNALGDAANPFHTGSGASWGHLAVMAAWGAVGALIAARGLSIEPRQSRAAAGAQRRARRRPADARPANTARPATWRLLVGEVRHTNALLWRDPASTFFAIGFPMLLLALMPQVFGRELPDGTPLPPVYAPTMAVYGAAVTAYVNMPEGLARARERGVLRRLRGTPLPLILRIAAGVVSAAWVGLVTLVLVLALGAVMYDVSVPATWPGVLVTFVLATVCFAVLGIALVTLLPTSRAVSAVALGTLLTLAFVSNIFIVGAQLPTFLDAIGQATPLRHAVDALASGYAVGATGSGLAGDHLAMIGAWLLLGVIVVVARADRLVSAAGRE